MIIDHDDVRRLALGLPEVTEADHHGRTSFRLGTAILATVPDERGLNVMVAESEAHAAVAESPSCSLLWWGKTVSGVRVELSAADAGLVVDLLGEAWRRRAPARLLREPPPSVGRGDADGPSRGSGA